MAFETEIAKATWPVADRRDFSKINNPMSMAELNAYAPGVNWQAWFDGAGIPAQKRIIVNENTTIRDLAKLYAATPLDTLKLWEKFHVTHQASPYLSKRFVDSRFNFTKTLSGVTEIRPRWKRGLTLVDGSLGELVGQTYVDKYFPATSKAKMEDLVSQPEAGDGRPHQEQQLDGDGNQGRRAREAVAHGCDGRLPGQVARLFEAVDQGRRSVRQRPAERRFRISIFAVRPRPNRSIGRSGA